MRWASTASTSTATRTGRSSRRRSPSGTRSGRARSPWTPHTRSTTTTRGGGTRTGPSRTRSAIRARVIGSAPGQVGIRSTRSRAWPDGPVSLPSRARRRTPTVIIALVRVGIDAVIGLTTSAATTPTIYRELVAAARAAMRPHDPDTAPLLRLTAENAYVGGAGDIHIYSEGQATATGCNDYPQLWDIHAPPSRNASSQYRGALEALRRDDPDAFAPFAIDDWVVSSSTLFTSCIRWPSPSEHVPAKPPGAPYPDVPVLVLDGALDSLTSPEGAAAVADRFPNATYVEVPNSTHVTALGDLLGCTSGAGPGLRADHASSAIPRAWSRTRRSGSPIGSRGRRRCSAPRRAPGQRSQRRGRSATSSRDGGAWAATRGVGLRGGTFTTGGYRHPVFTLVRGPVGGRRRRQRNGSSGTGRPVGFEPASRSAARAFPAPDSACAGTPGARWGRRWSSVRWADARSGCASPRPSARSRRTSRRPRPANGRVPPSAARVRCRGRCVPATWGGRPARPPRTPPARIGPGGREGAGRDRRCLPAPGSDTSRPLAQPQHRAGRIQERIRRIRIVLPLPNHVDAQPHDVLRDRGGIRRDHPIAEPHHLFGIHPAHPETREPVADAVACRTSRTRP